MTRGALVAVVLLLQGCAVSIGAGVHPERYDQPNVNLSAAIGVIQATHEFEGSNITGVCQHISGLDTNEGGRFGGLNWCGGMIPIEW